MMEHDIHPIGTDKMTLFFLEAFQHGATLSKTRSISAHVTTLLIESPELHKSMWTFRLVDNS